MCIGYFNCCCILLYVHTYIPGYTIFAASSPGIVQTSFCCKFAGRVQLIPLGYTVEEFIPVEPKPQKSGKW